MWNRLLLWISTRQSLSRPSAERMDQLEAVNLFILQELDRINLIFKQLADSGAIKNADLALAELEAELRDFERKGRLGFYVDPAKLAEVQRMLEQIKRHVTAPRGRFTPDEEEALRLYPVPKPKPPPLRDLKDGRVPIPEKARGN